VLGPEADSPNVAHWCFNKLEIRGEQAVVDAVVAGMRGAYSDGSECLFDFDRVLPPPPDLDPSDGDWRYETWGTHRHPIHCRTSDDSDAAFVLEFETASGPATGVVAALAARHPDLRFAHLYDFDDYGYGGELTYKDGELVDETSWHDDEEDEEDEGDEATPSVDSGVGDDEVEPPPSPVRPTVRLRRSALAADGADPSE
jgi:hypothetical protein